MVKLAIDIVLLPPEEIMDKAIEKNKELVEKGHDEIVLNKKSCLPHISLLMGVIDEKNLEVINKILKKIALSSHPIKLSISEVHLHELPDGNKSCDFKIKLTEDLIQLQSKVLEGLRDYIGYDANSSMFFNPQEMILGDDDWVNSFINNQVGEKFTPHITIGIGEPSPIKEKIKFTASKLALCHLGSCCTCREVLISIDLI